MLSENGNKRVCKDIGNEFRIINCAPEDDHGINVKSFVLPIRISSGNSYDSSRSHNNYVLINTIP